MFGLVPTEIVTAIKHIATTFQRTERRPDEIEQWGNGPVVKTPMTLERIDVMATC